MPKPVWLFLAATVLAAATQEKGAYDSRGRRIALIGGGGEVEVYSDYLAVMADGRRIPLVERRTGQGARDQGQLKSWTGSFGMPATARFRLEWTTNDSSAGLRYETKAASESGEFQSVEFVLDLRRDVFAGGKLSASTVFITAFRQGGTMTVNNVNRSVPRDAVLAGLPQGEWKVTETTEAAQFQSKPALRPGAADLRLRLPGRSLVTLTRASSAPGTNQAED
jgi:hypothetical protein